MRAFISAAFLSVLVLVTCIDEAPAQAAALASKETIIKPAANVLRPFGVGEVLTYEAKINRIIRGIGVADLTFKVIDAPGSNGMLITADARSKGTLLKLFRYSFFQKYD